MTAEEIIENRIKEHIDFFSPKSSGEWFVERDEVIVTKKALSMLIIEFAKNKAGEALKAASEKAETKTDYDWDEENGYDFQVVNKESILNAYSLDNIK